MADSWGLADEWEADEERARRAEIATAMRSREWIGARIARDWLMEELACPDYTAEKCLVQVAGSAVPIFVQKLERETLWRGSDHDGCWERLRLPSQEARGANRACLSLFSGYNDSSSSVQFDQDWLTGNFKLVDRSGGGDDMTIIRLDGARFHSASLADHFDLSVPPQSTQSGLNNHVQEAVRSVATGGRPASKHGDVIAAATLRLALLPPEELIRYTNASLSIELANEYNVLAEAAPSERNLDTYAGGILRVLRARQT